MGSDGIQRQSEMALQVLRILHSHGDLQRTLGEILKIIQKNMGVDAVGIRLQEGNDYPYFVFDGFQDEHILLENYLCAHDLEGQLMRDEVGDPVHECMCGNILNGRFDPEKPFFTEGGSFWSNNTTRLISTPSERDMIAKTRNTCNAEGYESVALIPIRDGGETLGLLQLNDFSASAFREEDIEFLEGLGRIIGVILSKIYREREVLHSLERHMTAFNSVPYPTFIIDPEDYTIIQANKFAIQLSTWNPGEVRGSTCHKVITGRDSPCDDYGETCPLLRVLEEGTTNVTTLHSWKAEYGGLACAEESVSPITDANGLIDAVVLVAKYIGAQDML